jgi:flagellar basal body-associated protein FliL
LERGKTPVRSESRKREIRDRLLETIRQMEDVQLST